MDTNFLTFEVQNEWMMSDQKKTAVLGGGSWATAIVKMLLENLDTVGWYMRSESSIAHIKKNNHNPKYLRAADVYADQLDFSSDINSIVDMWAIAILVRWLIVILDENTNIKATATWNGNIRACIDILLY